MLAESLTALAAAGGAAVVQAATTDAWTGLRVQVAQWFGRGDSRREQAQLERLDRTAAQLTASCGAEREQVRQETVWQTLIEQLLESLEDAEREQAAADLRALLKETSAAGGVSAGADGAAAGRDINVKADNGSIAAAVLEGGAHIGHPPVPDPSQG